MHGLLLRVRVCGWFLTVVLGVGQAQSECRELKLGSESATLAVQRVERQVDLLKSKLADVMEAEEAAHATASNAEALVDNANRRRDEAEAEVCASVQPY